MTFINLLTLLFVALKLTNFIDWSWWWVLSPTLLNVFVTVTSVTYLLFRKS